MKFAEVSVRSVLLLMDLANCTDAVMNNAVHNVIFVVLLDVDGKKQ